MYSVHKYMYCIYNICMYKIHIICIYVYSLDTFSIETQRIQAHFYSIAYTNLTSTLFFDVHSDVFFFFLAYVKYLDCTVKCTAAKGKQ